MPTQRTEGSIVVLDSREFRRAGIVELLKPWAADQSLSVLASSPVAVLELLDEPLDLRLILVSVGSASISGREIQQQIKVLRALGGSVPIVIITDREDADEVVVALGLGVQGFLPTAIRPELALQALTFIVSGGSYFPPAAIQQLQRSQPPETPPTPGHRGAEESGDGGKRSPHRSSGGPDYSGAQEEVEPEASGPAMTNRQKEVLSLLCHGEPNKIIARKLGMTEATVKVHVRQIMRKLGATNRTQAALSAVDFEIVGESDVVRDTGVRAGHEPRLYAAE